MAKKVSAKKKAELEAKAASDGARYELEQVLQSCLSLYPATQKKALALLAKV